MTTVTAPTAAPSIPFAPAGLLEWQTRRIISSGQLAIARGLRLIARGVCRVAGHVGAPVYVVSSGSRPGLGHLVWVEGVRIQCDCEWRTVRGGFTCSHAQFVRTLIVAELAEPRSVPPIARASEPAPKPAPEPAPKPAPEPPAPAPAPKRPRRCRACGEPAELDDFGECVPCAKASSKAIEAQSAHAARAGQLIAAIKAGYRTPAVAPEPPTPAPAPTRKPCPTCGGQADAAEVDDIGECVDCLLMREDQAREEAREETEREEARADQLPCWCCGAPATAETDHGLYCDACVKLAPAEQRRRIRARHAAEKVEQTRARVAERMEAQEKAEEKARQKAQTSGRVIAREKARERAGIPSAASPSAASPRAARRRKPQQQAEQQAEQN